jgi:hypothetical protein
MTSRKQRVIERPKRKIGRPSKYTPQLLALAESYIDNFSELDNDVIPTNEGLCEWIGINDDTLYEWLKHEDKKEISEVVKQVQKKQKRIISNSGITGEFNANISKLFLSQHGIIEKKQIEQTTTHKAEQSAVDLFSAILEQTK